MRVESVLLRIEKLGRTMQDRHAIALIETGSHFHLAFDYGAGCLTQGRHIELWNLPRVSQQGVVAKLGHLKNGMPQRFAGNGAEMGACSTDAGHAFHDGDRFILLGGLHGGAFAAGSGTDHDQVKVRFQSTFPFVQCTA